MVISQKISCACRSKSPLKKRDNILYIGDTPLLQYIDMDFDGVRDFVIYASGSVYDTGNNAVYLSKGRTFEMDTTLPSMNLHSCGIYQADSTTKQIRISDQCESYHHQCYTLFSFREGAFRWVESLQAFDDYYEPYYTQFVYTRSGRKPPSRDTKYVVNAQREDFSAEFSFGFKDSNKVYLLLDEDHTDTTLSFFYTDANHTSMEHYVNDRSANAYTLDTRNPKETTLSFRSKQTHYTLYQKNRGKKITEVGLVVQKGTQRVKHKGILSTRTGDLRRLKDEIVSIKRKQ